MNNRIDVLKTVLPKHASLKRFVDFFYLFRSDESEKWSHTAFPHVNTGLSFLNRVSVNRDGHTVYIREDRKANCSIEILGKYTHPVLVRCEGVVDEVAIVFKPLGVNRFIREDFIDVAPHFSQPYFDSQWLKAANELFCSENRLEFLEEFLLYVLSDKEQFIKMEQAVSMFETNEFDYSVTDVAKKMGINLKTFQRNFTKMMACSPSDYKRIARFRNALKSKFQSTGIKLLTEITYEQNYTDQSYFIKEFRKLTNQNPKLFFKEVSQVDGDKIIWEIL